MTIYRLHHCEYPANQASGKAARWNYDGEYILYCAATVSLCALELLAHFASTPRNYCMTAIEIAEDIQINAVSAPKRFVRDDPEPTRQIGSAWLKSRASAVLRVPSIIVRLESNYLLNPAHPDFDRIRFDRLQRFSFDPRLKAFDRSR